MNDLPNITTKNAKLVLTSPSPKEFKIYVNKLFRDINEWFKTNLLSLNFGKKTHYLQFRNKNRQEINVDQL
jgi:hypothetical protein